MLWISKPRTDFMLCAALSIAVIFAPSAEAQTSSAPNRQASPEPGGLLEFQVATIKPVDLQASNNSMGTEVDPGGTVRLNSLPLKAMIQVAFDVRYWQIGGGEPWMEKTLYNVVAKPPDDVRESNPDTRHTLFGIEDPALRKMLQALLIQRFKLKVHYTTQNGKVYFLERTSKKLALVPTKAVSSGSSSPQSTYGSIGFVGSPTGQWGLNDTTMPELANFASTYVLHRPVMDHTGLVGAFDYEAAPEDWTAHRADLEGSFISLLNEIGLKLEPTAGQAAILMIDHAELPSPN